MMPCDMSRVTNLICHNPIPDVDFVPVYVFVCCVVGDMSVVRVYDRCGDDVCDCDADVDADDICISFVTIID